MLLVQMPDPHSFDPMSADAMRSPMHSSKNPSKSALQTGDLPRRLIHSQHGHSHSLPTYSSHLQLQQTNPLLTVQTSPAASRCFCGTLKSCATLSLVMRHNTHQIARNTQRHVQERDRMRVRQQICDHLSLRSLAFRSVVVRRDSCDSRSSRSHLPLTEHPPSSLHQ